MTSSQIKWAAQHDWYRGALQNDAGEWLCQCLEQGVRADGSLYTYPVCFFDFTAMYAWAGY